MWIYQDNSGKNKTVQEIKTSEFGRLGNILDAELASKLTLLEINSENDSFCAAMTGIHIFEHLFNKICFTYISSMNLSVKFIRAPCYLYFAK